MPCGCQSACGCSVVGDGTTAEVTRNGDEFTVSAIPVITDVEDTDCVSLEISDPDKVLRAELILDDDPMAVVLECTPDGLRADLVLDPASSATVTQGPDGLRVDVPVVSGTGNEQPGDMIFHMGIGARIGAIDADGQPVLRAGYSELWDALSLVATTATRTAGVDIVTDIPSTRFLAAGMPIELTSFPFGTTIVSVDSGTTITVSNPAGNSGSDTEVRAYPHGAGDGITTFNTPNMNNRVPLGYDYVGAGKAIGFMDGQETVTLLESEIPTHTHLATVGGSASVGTAISGAGSITATSDTEANHTHPPATADRLFVEVDDGVGTAQQVRFQSDGGGDSDLVVDDNDPNTTYGQKTDAQTGGAGSHAHDTTIGGGAIAGLLALTSGAVSLASVTVTNADAGGDGAHDNMPPYNVGRWMVVT